MCTNILVVAPHPFYLERGTPIACRLLIKTLCEHGNQVDLLTYPEGKDVQIDGLSIYRPWSFPFLKNIPIGFSVKKLICDFLLIFNLLVLFSRKKYDVVHAGEEAVFLALFMKFIHGCPVVYDMDSSLADQVVEKMPNLSPLAWFLDEFEKISFRDSSLILPVCQALADKVTSVDRNKNLEILEDVFFESDSTVKDVEDLRNDLGEDEKLLLYIGNLETYQGIDLLIEAVTKLKRELLTSGWKLKLIGGIESDISHYRNWIDECGLTEDVCLLGPRSLESLPDLLKQADVLLSPRTKGGNTPMKLYSYLASGVPVLATRIRSHTQAVNDDSCQLVDPNSISMAEGLCELLVDSCRAASVGENGKALALSRFSYETYRTKLLRAYVSLLDGMKADAVV